ncbi:hypothetical protein KUW19_18995 [Ferrimonas balearica]|uniref:delta-class carbonic anhydrase n=1 Tax=Ferrimonas balearica TaxID=44012 RepID=UPI001C937666|nr:delta-class carbonic anhydrase [Ferrimonas balearica]MBY6108554.1 hypothetical protein [Ferrimonas balearica]
MKQGHAWLLPTLSLMVFSTGVLAKADQNPVADTVIARQQAALHANAVMKGFGPQSPRNIDEVTGLSSGQFSAAPPYQRMNLCNIHFHSGAEHSGGEFTQYAGNGDGKGHYSGYLYSGRLSAAERRPIAQSVCSGKQGGLQSGDTIEVHFVHTTAEVQPGPTLGACFNDANSNPQLRVEAQVYVLVNDADALDFGHLTQVEQVGAYYQVVNLPNNLGDPVAYAGSTSGPDFNERGSPFQVSWRVHPEVAKVNVRSLGRWCQGNRFNEDHGHGVRNLITNPALLSPIL